MDAELPLSARTVLFTEAASEIAGALVGRDCRFAALAVSLISVTQISVPARALLTGGLLTLVGGVILVALALRTRQREMQHSEIWRSMNPALRIAPEQAFPVLRTALRAAYLRFARIAVWAGAALLVMAGLYVASSA